MGVGTDGTKVEGGGGVKLLGVLTAPGLVDIAGEGGGVTVPEEAAPRG